jgi:chromosomal replication initiator protein
VRALEGALNRVTAYAAVLGQPLGIEAVRQALRPLEEPGAREVSPDRVLATVAHHFGVTVEALRGKARDHAIAWPRQVAMYLLREETPASLSQIGQHLGGRDHSTVLHGCNQVTSKLAGSGHVRRELDEMRAAIHG